MKSVGALVLVVAAAVFLAAPPALAYDLTLTQWNVTELNTAGDSIGITISGSTITYTWLSGDLTSPEAFNLQDIYWSSLVAADGGSLISTSAGTYTDQCASPPCNADGFGGFQVDYRNFGTTTTSVMFTFSGIFTAAEKAALTNDDFALHVQYGGGCSGIVDGTIGGDSIKPNSTCTPGTSVPDTPVPEPITMFLGGTGLLILGYAARKRLFGGRLASAA
jgi:hypothetical protein